MIFSTRPRHAQVSCHVSHVFRGPFWARLHRTAQHKKLPSFKFSSLIKKYIVTHQIYICCILLVSGTHPLLACPENHVELWLVSLFFVFLPRKRFHAKQIVVLSSFMKLGPGCLYRLGYIDWKNRPLNTSLCLWTKHTIHGTYFHVRLVSSCSDMSCDQWHLLSNNTWQCPGGIDQSTHTLRDGLADGPLYGM